jgi:hypothetical protein
MEADVDGVMTYGDFNTMQVNPQTTDNKIGRL